MGNSFGIFFTKAILGILILFIFIPILDGVSKSLESFLNYRKFLKCFSFRGFQLLLDKNNSDESINLATPFALFFALITISFVPIFDVIRPGSGDYYFEIFNSELGIVCLWGGFSLTSFFLVLANLNYTKSENSYFFHKKQIMLLISQLILLTAMASYLFYYGSWDLREISQAQIETGLFHFAGWGLFRMPFLSILTFFAILMSLGLTPFSFWRGVEVCKRKSSFEKGIFYWGEHINKLVGSLIFIFLCLGGHSPLPALDFFIELIPNSLFLIELISLTLKVFIVYFVIEVIKYLSPEISTYFLITSFWRKILPLMLVISFFRFSYYLWGQI